MKTVIIMFDTLTRHFLPNYGNDWVQAPTFKHLAKKMVTFDHFYGGSMPCMPARRELHTGRYNFLHRSWGQIEAFDRSVFDLLKKHGVYTHMVTDHSHYWEDGGSTYHNRYDTWQGFRGQESDRWTPLAKAQPYTNNNVLNKPKPHIAYNLANRTHLLDEDAYSSVQTINAGLDFLKTYQHEDNWLLQIECFDPHEPFLVPQKYRDLYGLKSDQNVPNYPKYQFLSNQHDTHQVELMKKEYAALISMIDAHLKKIIDFFDAQNLWKDTMLIINTDHGFSFGEHNFIGKNLAPFYDQIIHTPFFIHVPNFINLAGTRIDQIAQTIDIPLTILDYFNIKDDFDRDGQSLLEILKNSQSTHETILFGMNGAHVGIFDGRYVYMRASAHANNLPYTQYTLNFNFLRGFFPKQVLLDMQLVAGSRYSDGVPILKINFPENRNDSYQIGHLLYDMDNDPEQLHPLNAHDVEMLMVQKLISKLKTVDCPKEEFIRLGLDNNE